MIHPFRQFHLLQIMRGYESQSLPLDLFIGSYFREHKALGSKDRAQIAEIAYGLVRWHGLLDYGCPGDSSWEERIDLFCHPTWEELKNKNDIPPHIRVSFPSYLFERIVASYGPEKALEICKISNESAPTTVRVNSLKAKRDDLLHNWELEYEAKACDHTPYGIHLPKRIPFSSMPEFKNGLFEIQDEGSQLIAQLVRVQPGEKVMDFCAGAGGKTLAFAPQMQNKGQIYLHDIRQYALNDAKKRLRRAGIQNAQIIHDSEIAKLKKLTKTMDWVLVDAPCTGTGTIRRNPDMKWKFDEAMLKRLLGQQRTIFEKGLSFLKPGGHIVYATCSILQEENRAQLAHFMQTYQLECVGEPFESLPVSGGMDGFFGVILRRN